MSQLPKPAAPMSLLRFSQPLIASRELPAGRLVPIGVGDEKLILLRRNGALHAYPERCPHRGTALLHGSFRGDPGDLACPYHGWRISSAGTVRDGRGDPVPSCDFVPFALEEKLGYVWLARSKPVEISAPEGFQFCGSEGFTLSAPFHVVLDNFNEGSHTPYIHGLTGPTPEQQDQIAFSWSDQPDHVEIRYRGPQRKNPIFYGLRGLLPGDPKIRVIWDIVWRTYLDPVRMVYESAWFPEDRPDEPMFQTRHYYFIAPLGAERTRFHAFSFARFGRCPAILHPLLRPLTARLTRNQVLEDERFYARIRDLPMDFAGMHFECFDLPLLRVRKRADLDYFGAGGQSDRAPEA